VVVVVVVVVVGLVGVCSLRLPMDIGGSDNFRVGCSTPDDDDDGRARCRTGILGQRSSLVVLPVDAKLDTRVGDLAEVVRRGGRVGSGLGESLTLASSSRLGNGGRGCCGGIVSVLVLNISDELSCPDSGSSSDLEDGGRIAAELTKCSSVREDEGGGDLEKERRIGRIGEASRLGVALWEFERRVVGCLGEWSLLESRHIDLEEETDDEIRRIGFDVEFPRRGCCLLQILSLSLGSGDLEERRRPERCLRRPPEELFKLLGDEVGAWCSSMLLLPSSGEDFSAVIFRRLPLLPAGAFDSRS
jgi:hypothetical protein